MLSLYPSKDTSVVFAEQGVHAAQKTLRFSQTIGTVLLGFFTGDAQVMLFWAPSAIFSKQKK